MSGNHAIGNRNSTPEANNASSLRPPSSRAVGTGNPLRSSADMSTLQGSAPSSRIRPSSDFYGHAQQVHGQATLDHDAQDKIAQQWIADIDQYETTLEEMAAATLDQDFKDELSAIEQWFRVLSEAERTAALYALLQQTTQVQIRFFIQVLQQMGKNHPMSGVLSPANFDKDPMSSRLNDAMNKLNVDSARNSYPRNTAVPSTKRHSGLDPSTITAMFPDAAAAIATEKAKFTQQTGNSPASNRNSVGLDPRNSVAPSISTSQEPRDVAVAGSASPWGSGPGNDTSGTKLPASQTPMGQFVQQPAGGLRSPRPQVGGSTIQSTTVSVPEKNPADLPLLSPYNAGSGNWASMVNTPMAPSFNTSASSGNQADMVANATAMKLAALSTVNNRFALDDVRKYRRTRSNDPSGSSGHNQMSPPPQNINMPGANVVMINEHGQVLNREHVLAMQAQQGLGLSVPRSRPSSPGIALQSGMGPVSHFTSPQHNGFLSAYDGSTAIMPNGMPSVNLGQLGIGGHEGYLSDHSDMVRGRSPRGRRGSSKPPEDPTDPTLLQDIPSWLRSLRLHKYTDNLKDMKWNDLVELDDKALEERGVNALGARRKMLKVFEQVKGASNNQDASDADSDLEELQGDIAKFDESVREFLATHQGSSSLQRTVRGGPRGRGARGPRKAAKPRGDITARLSKVNQAFLSGDYDLAVDLAFEVIRINAETHQAWTSLSSIFRERGELDRALSAMVYAAHLRPKDVSGWLKCATFALETIDDEDENRNLQTARLCYSAALRADPMHSGARLGKAAVCHRQGHLTAAISEYKYVLKRRPYDLDLVRKLAEACMDTKNAAVAIPSAIEAYRQFFHFAISSGLQGDVESLWHDIGIYMELFASLNHHREAIFEAKALSRWLAGRGSEQHWDSWQDDDREWDVDDSRRSFVPGFNAADTDPALYGNALPQDLRIRLATYRFRLGDEAEALKHLQILDWTDVLRREFVNDYPLLAYELTNELARSGHHPQAIQYYRLLREIPGDADPAVLLQLGRCHLAVGEQSSAEECFIEAIDADDGAIDARIELANMYEKAREDKEALILAAEAMALREAQVHSVDFESEPVGASSANRRVKASSAPKRPRKPRVGAGDVPTSSGSGASERPVVPKRYRPRRLAGPDRRLQEEQARAIKLSNQYETVQSLRQQISAGREDLIPLWMATSRELVDDFRSLKRFYTWDRYLYFLGSKQQAPATGAAQPDSELTLMYERLSRSIAPQLDQNRRETGFVGSNAHRGISFDDWLDLFLDYAIGLASAHRRDEAYQICQAAKDSTVFQSPEHVFTIHVAWSVCAVYANDEERCVTLARFLMREGTTTDSYRLFALLSRLCQSPVSWYTSGPAQKFILRQIKAIDASHTGIPSEHEVQDRDDNDVPSTADPAVLSLDVCLLMLYGHILFTSTSYAYSLGYFLRARSLDPTNPMINLSLGLAYVHYGLKRQSANRQYLLLQGQAFLSRYLEPAGTEPDESTSERLYNVGRLFHLLGIGHLASRYYNDAMGACAREGGNQDMATCILINSIMGLLSVKNSRAAFSLLKCSLHL
ncbi:hypothetical protein HIM_04445 [Hirsutella minnesotensis 3608]|uniref:RNA-binding protein VTS1 n=1 Tax=Hirsutella minnesotensis 3608 TaxID=1043627 RepID=A0A0F8A5V5_9HYPO|nr:hypothetical protein HIM_04445 [Hirsutella minnesotensis 3608]